MTTIQIDTVLSEKIGIYEKKYKTNKKELENSIIEISSLLNVDVNNDDIINFVLTFYKVGNKIPSKEDVKECINVSKEYSNDNILLLLPLLSTIKIVRFITKDKDVSTFFQTLSKSVKFAAADLGNENNQSFLRSCVKVMDYSFIEELEARGIDIVNNKLTFVDAINDEFKKGLFDRFSEKIELLKFLKDEIFKDEKIPLAEIDIVTIDQTISEKDVIATSTVS